ncbi:MAG: glycoside hydrolase family 127 protein [Prolixibacteraceae bacterium]|nr:glycoside hydrolase family 127 protein [Prolixibacteraceae bacterium]
MKNKIGISFLGVVAALLLFSNQAVCNSHYSNNRYPLVRKPYIELPLGSIKTDGWLIEMLKRQRDGATGQMDKLYPLVMGERNGWLGGDGDQWERGPYWIDGLLPLAYILDDQQLKDKVKPWIEWILQSQREDGFFGPDKDYPYEYGVQRNNSHDWWPRMVVLKILQQYYSATGDERVITFLSKYFDYQLKTLPEKHLGSWTFWARYRAGDNMDIIYWLYNITGQKALLDLSNIIHSQGHNFVSMFLDSDDMKRLNTIHCVNLAQGFKEPVIYYQQSGNPDHLKSVEKGFADLKHFNGQAQGMYGADEGLHGKNPTQGVELCSVVEMMFSLEKMIEITGNMNYMEHLERVAFNALPTQVTDDFMFKQYFQQANQVMVTRHPRNFYEENSHGSTDILFGTLSGYPCCYSNMHQGWPKFAKSLWFATPDNGLAALVFAPSEVTAKVANGIEVKIAEKTCYPMDDKIEFKLQIQDKKVKSVYFPFHVRIPVWCNEATLTINGQVYKTAKGGNIEIIEREWKTDDIVELKIPMSVRIDDSWHEKSISVERGPLVFALRMEEEWEKKRFDENERNQFGDSYWEVRSKTPWNYAIVNFDRNKINEAFDVIIDNEKLESPYPWNLENAPVRITTEAKKIPTWTLYNEMTGPLPFSVQHSDEPIEEITLIPYGCTTLRISEFPLVWR